MKSKEHPAIQSEARMGEREWFGMSTEQVETLRVLECVPEPGANIRFIDQIVRYAPPHIRFSFISWSHALFGRYDVVHIHWPEHLIRGRRGLRRILQLVLYSIWLIRLSVCRTPIVRTLHNVHPHEELGRTERWLMTALDRLVHTWVIMTNCTIPKSSTTPVIIPHGEYRAALGNYPAASPIPGRVLTFGRIRPYKGTLQLIQAAEEISPAGITREIRIVGSPTPNLKSQIEQELSRPGRIGVNVSTLLETVTDSQMVQEITAAELVVLPYQDAGNGNSGVALVALSLGRPVLVPRCCIMERLAEEVGSGWVHFIETQITGADIERALQSARIALADGAEPPRFVHREWTAVAQEYAEVFMASAKCRPLQRKSLKKIQLG